MSIEILVARKESVLCHAGLTSEVVEGRICVGYRMEGGYLSENGVMLISNGIINADHQSINQFNR
jgi:hypothetical protein